MTFSVRGTGKKEFANWMKKNRSMNGIFVMRRPDRMTVQSLEFQARMEMSVSPFNAATLAVGLSGRAMTMAFARNLGHR